MLVAGRYEGIDERVVELAIDRELSIGDYVVSGGELPALVLIDALARLQPGALGDERSSSEESFVAGMLDWPHYTRPEVFEGRRVPPVLSSGDHAAIARWRLKQALGRTWLTRPELIGRPAAAAPLDGAQRALLEEFLLERDERTRDEETTMSNIIQTLEAERMTRKVPDFKPGDTVVVQIKVVEGDRERVQAYEGVVIARSNRGFNSSFTVRKISHGEGVERTFQTHSPSITESRSSGAAACGAPSSTICASAPARPRASRKKSRPSGARGRSDRLEPCTISANSCTECGVASTDCGAYCTCCCCWGC